MKIRTVISHFYKWSEEESKYVHNEAMGMIQTPQDFYNVPKDDPLGQRYRCADYFIIIIFFRKQERARVN